MLKQVFLINTDLKMGKGKIAVQVAHGEIFYMETVLRILSPSSIKETEMIISYAEWRLRDQLMKKIVLKATEKEIHDFIDIYGSTYWMKMVIDKGLTQVPEDSLTCLVIEPLPEEKCDEIFNHLKLL